MMTPTAHPTAPAGDPGFLQTLPVLVTGSLLSLAGMQIP